MYILFYDLYSGGSPKEEWGEIYIEADGLEEASDIFEGRFGHTPGDTTMGFTDYAVIEDADPSNAIDTLIVIDKTR